MFGNEYIVRCEIFIVNKKNEREDYYDYKRLGFK